MRKGRGEIKQSQTPFLLGYLLQFPLLGLGGTRALLPLCHAIPLSSRWEHCAVLPVHRQLQLHQIQWGAAAGLEQGRRRRASTSCGLRRRGAGLGLSGGLGRLRRRGAVDGRRRVSCLRSELVVRGVEIGRRQEGHLVRGRDHTVILGGEALRFSVVHRLRLRQSSSDGGVHIVGQQ